MGRAPLVIMACLIGVGLLTGMAFAETLYIQSKTAKLRSGKTTLDRVVADLKAGDPLELLRRDGTWVEVRTVDGVKGWLPASNTTTVRPSGRDEDLVRGESFPHTEASDTTGTAGTRGIGEGSPASPKSIEVPVRMRGHNEDSGGW